MTVHAPKTFLPATTHSAGAFFAPLQREIDRVLQEFGQGFGAFSAPMSPSMDVRETKETIEVDVELPGMKREDIEVSLDGDVLVISGEKKSETRDDKEQRVVERTYGAFSRSVQLPRGVDPEKIDASMTDGVLKVVIAKPANAETRTIEIKAA